MSSSSNSQLADNNKIIDTPIKFITTSSTATLVRKNSQAHLEDRTADLKQTRSLGQICALTITRTNQNNNNNNNIALPVVQGDRVASGGSVLPFAFGYYQLGTILDSEQANRSSTLTTTNNNNNNTNLNNRTISSTEPKLSWYRKFVGGSKLEVGGKQGKFNNNNSFKSNKSGSRRASIIVSASSNFVDKLTYMIKKSNKTITSEFEAAGGGTRAAELPAARQASAVAATAAPLERNGLAMGGSQLQNQQQQQQPEQARSSGSGNNRYQVISELGRRFLRRCKHSKAVRFATRNYCSSGGKFANGIRHKESRTKVDVGDKGDTGGSQAKLPLATNTAGQTHKLAGCGAALELASAPARLAARACESESNGAAADGVIPGISPNCNGNKNNGLLDPSGSSSMADSERDDDDGRVSRVSQRPFEHLGQPLELAATTAELQRQTASGATASGGGDSCNEPQSQSQARSGNHKAQAQTSSSGKQLAQATAGSIEQAPTQQRSSSSSSNSNNNNNNNNNNLTTLNSSSSSSNSTPNTSYINTTTNATTPACCGASCLCDDAASSSGFIGSPTNSSGSALVSSPDSITINSCSSSTTSSTTNNPSNNDHHHHNQAPDSSGQIQHYQHAQLTGSSRLPPSPLATATTLAQTGTTSNNSSTRSSRAKKLPSFFASTIMMIETKGQQQQPSPTSDNTHLQSQPQVNPQDCAGKKGSASSTTSSTSAGSSFLSRARNSTINLTSLATVTHRFNCSASVGNLWSSYGGNSQQQKRELAELSGDSRDIKPLDYIGHGQFDQYDPLNESQCSNNNNNIHHTIIEPPEVVEGNVKLAGKGSSSKGSGGHLFSIGSAPVSRKSSSKEKKKRQKDADKVEKLRLLVSYLKSGTSQPVLKPVTLEADEIELANKYKLHLILCEDCLQQVEVEQQQIQQQQQQQFLQNRKPRARLTASASTGSILNSRGPAGAGGSWSPSALEDDEDGSLAMPEMSMAGHLSTIAGIVINVRRSSEQLMAANAAAATASASVAASNMSSGTSSHNNNNTSSPSLVVPAVASPPNNLSVGHSLNSASSPSIDEHNGSTYSSNSSNNSDHNLHQHHLLNDDHINQDLLHSDQDYHNHAHNTLQPPHFQQQLLCYKCKKPTGRNVNSIISSSADLTASASVASDIDSNLSTSYNQELHTTLIAADAQHQQSTPPSHNNNNNNNNNTNLLTNHNHHQYHHQNPGYNQSTNTTSVLATWIDNEVNSLVNDLEAKSQLVRDEKHAKSSGKRKWLSSSNSSRRNSSGAHST